MSSILSINGFNFFDSINRWDSFNPINEVMRSIPSIDGINFLNPINCKSISKRLHQSQCLHKIPRRWWECCGSVWSMRTRMPGDEPTNRCCCSIILLGIYNVYEFIIPKLIFIYNKYLLLFFFYHIAIYICNIYNT